jgi:hypothetical protein
LTANVETKAAPAKVEKIDSETRKIRALLEPEWVEHSTKRHGAEITPKDSVKQVPGKELPDKHVFPRPHFPTAGHDSIGCGRSTSALWSNHPAPPHARNSEMKTALSALALSFALSAAASQAASPDGVLHARDVVPAYGTITYHAYLLSGEITRISVSGDHSTDLDLYVYDSNGNCVASDPDYSDECRASFMPLWSDNFTIRVVNRGSVWNEFGIVVH